MQCNFTPKDELITAFFLLNLVTGPFFGVLGIVDAHQTVLIRDLEVAACGIRFH